MTPIRKPGEPTGETYVVCLDCGKQFAYDWNRMRIGDPIAQSAESGVLQPNMPGANTTKLKYALLGSAIPLAVVVGGSLLSKRRSKTPAEVQPTSPVNAHGPEQYIALPHGGPGVRFTVNELLEYIGRSGRDYIIIGQVDCALADHPRPSSLDYWLREHFARNKETKQASAVVVEQLLATGRFEAVDQVRCPDTGERSQALRVKAPRVA